MSLELKHLRYFVAVAQELNFSAAARRLYISQQALSRIIQQLERELGVRVLERTTRSVELTAAGEALLASAPRSIATVEEALEEARRAARNDRPRPLRVDVSSASLQTPALILRRLRHEHPDLPVHLVEDGVPRGLVALQEGRLDALFGLATHCPREVPAELIRREPVLVGMTAGHPLGNLDAVPVAMLADVELLLPSDTAAPEWVELVRQLCGKAGFTPRRWRGATHGSAAAADVLREEGCVTPTVAWADPPGDLAFRPLVEPSAVLEWSMMLSPVAKGRAELDLLVRCVRAAADEQGWLTPVGALPGGVGGAAGRPTEGG
ncbi:MAG TPA: LysR family transcriptional regulator [Actinomycetes bacterium]|nr:LysR family transcriptional regulator [Actinomycetes bacterium]